jgi:tetrahydromethanopterin S-methyltransferase subunit D
MTSKTAYLGSEKNIAYILHVWGASKNEWLVLAQNVGGTKFEYHPSDFKRLPNTIRSIVNSEKERCIRNIKAS